MQWVLGQDADLGVRDAYGETILHQLAKRQNARDALQILQGNLVTSNDLKIRSKAGETALALAVNNGLASLLPAYQAKGDDFLQRDGQGNTLLHVAAASTHGGGLETLQWLLRFGLRRHESND